MKRFRQHVNAHENRQAGYMLLMMMLFISMLAIASLAIVPRIEMQAKRDREEEMIHRGAQYARAIRHYVKKFGRYPTSVSDLLDTNNVHFLRKAYKDPITGKDFRLLHMQDVQALMGAGGFGPGGFTGNPGAAAGAGQPGMPAGVPATNSSGTTPDASGQPDNSPRDSLATNDGGDNSGGTNGATASQSESSGPGGGQVFGGGPVMGVASNSKDKTVRMFNNKEHYNEWLFVYDPTNDRGLITGPYQPSLMSMGVGQPAGTNANGTANTGGFGNQGSNGFQPIQQQNPMNQIPQR
jgi:type II secretory pathway pseudopilin PulG